MRILGLDVGTKTIGVAISDQTCSIAGGLTTIKRQSLEKDINALKQIQKEYSPQIIVMGLPKNMNGTIGEQAIFVQNFGETVQKALNVKIHYIDERLTTVQASRALREANISAKKQKGIIDKQAAILILQNFLDKNKGSLKNE